VNLIVKGVGNMWLAARIVTDRLRLQRRQHWQ
jgi:hypothetical protein